MSLDTSAEAEKIADDIITTSRQVIALRGEASAIASELADQFAELSVTLNDTTRPAKAPSERSIRVTLWRLRSLCELIRDTDAKLIRMIGKVGER